MNIKKTIYQILIGIVFLQNNNRIQAVSETNEELFSNKKILILGGTGYLGRAIALELLKYNPREVYLFSRDEVKHFNVSKIFHAYPNVKHIIGDIRDFDSLLKATKNMDIVFHVAALKRMDMLESNVDEAIKTNILGSLNVFNACVQNEVKKVLFVSTDKACSPINIYGACKFASEKIFTNYDKAKISTKFVTSRFGNILDSTGSVIPIFIEKIKNNEEIPLTDGQMTRFIIYKDEAVKLMFDALRYTDGGEIFSKKLLAFKITDLIDVLRDHFKASNKTRFIGIRPGEKMHEMMINESEMLRTYEFDNYYIILSSLNNKDIEKGTNLPIYRGQGRPLSESMIYYSSDQAVIPPNELISHFKNLGLL